MSRLKRKIDRAEQAKPQQVFAVAWMPAGLFSKDIMSTLVMSDVPLLSLNPGMTMDNVSDEHDIFGVKIHGNFTKNLESANIAGTILKSFFEDLENNGYLKENSWKLYVQAQ